MTYSAFGLLAVIIHLIVNYDVFHKKIGSTFPASRYYRQFLLSVILFHISDALWGIFNERTLTIPLFVASTAFFLTIAVGVLFWTMFVVHYLEEKRVFCTIINYVGRLFFIFQVSTVGANCFVPIVFSVDSAGIYHPHVVRYALFLLQILILFITSVYTLIIAIKSHGSIKRRHLTIGLFGLAMILAITAQLFYTFWPLYSIGYLVGCCMLHTFVIEDERTENFSALKEALGREALQIEELGATRTLAYTDPLTGVKSKRAYLDIRKQLEQKIADNTVKEFALTVFDVNGLKEVNDNLVTM